MAQKFPFSFVAEYRGKEAQGGERTDPASGEVIAWSAGLKFEVTMPDGDVELLMFRAQQVDRIATFDVEALQKGDYVRLEGMCQIGKRDGESSYSRLLAVALADEAEALRAA